MNIKIVRLAGERASATRPVAGPLQPIVCVGLSVCLDAELELGHNKNNRRQRLSCIRAWSKWASQQQDYNFTHEPDDHDWSRSWRLDTGTTITHI